jgi:hypothetical protein
MNIRIESNFSFSVSSIQYAHNGELQITLTSDEKQTDNRYLIKKDKALKICR